MAAQEQETLDALSEVAEPQDVIERLRLNAKATVGDPEWLKGDGLVVVRDLLHEAADTLEAGVAPKSDPSPAPSPQALLYAALARAQGAFPPIPRDRTVRVQTKTGGSYTFSYAPLDTILDKVRPALAANGLALTQIFHGENLVTSLLHEDGGTIESTLALPRQGSSWQEYGSAITYARRYTLVALLGIASEEDDDGNAASGNTATASDKDKARNTKAKPEDEQEKRNKQLAAIHIIKRKLIDAGLTEEKYDENLVERYGSADLTAFTPEQLTDLVTRLRDAEKAITPAK